MKYDYLESNVKFLEYGGKNLLMRKMLFLETARDLHYWSKFVALNQISGISSVCSIKLSIGKRTVPSRLCPDN